MNVFSLWKPFINLFGGLEDSAAVGAFGTGRGGWVKRPLTPGDVVDHLQGKGPGIGVPPLRPDNTVVFASIDLDEPDFDAALWMQKWIPGQSFVERSRSGNAHIHVFFERPIPAWVPMGILRAATKAAGKEHVEVFPKNHDFARVKLGNYINLPYYGNTRPILWHPGAPNESTYTLENFILTARHSASKNDPEKWIKRAEWMQIVEPSAQMCSEPGTQKVLHMCAEYIIGRILDGTAPVTEGHRNNVYFALAKQLRNCEYISDEEALAYLLECNDASPDPENPRELVRIFNNAEGKTSTGCDDPLVAPFTHPDCPIAHPRS